MERTLANIEIELYEKDGKLMVYLANDGSSGVKYPVKSIEDLRKVVADYTEMCYEDNK